MPPNEKRSFKLRLSRVIPSFNLCRSKYQPHNPINTSRPDPPRPIPGTGQHAPARRSSSFSKKTFSTAECGCRSFYVTERDDFTWMKDDAWLVVAKVPDCESTRRPKVYASAANRRLVSTPTTKMMQLRRRNKNIHLRISPCSFETWETEQLISPSSTSSDSVKTKSRNRELLTSPARVSSVMQRVMGCYGAEGKVRESLAVVKRSEDPYEDFKRSMMEMILEKEMFRAAELQQLLECFLSLNSKHYYPTILRAFFQVCETLFSEN